MSMAYLNRGFIRPAWTHAADLLANEIIHGAWEDADKEGLHLHESQTTMNMTAVPAFTMAGSNLKLRFPGTGSYTLSTYVEKHIDGVPDIGTSVSVSLWAEMTIGTGAPAVDVHVDVDSGLLGDIADWTTGWEDDLKERIKVGFGKHLGFFSTVRYDSSIALALPNPELVSEFAELDPQKAIDIVLVSDGFTASNMNDFRVVVDAFRTRLTTSAASHMNEPYFSFDTVIRIWKIEVPSQNPKRSSSSRRGTVLRYGVRFVQDGARESGPHGGDRRQGGENRRGRDRVHVEPPGPRRKRARHGNGRRSDAADCGDLDRKGRERPRA